MLGVENPRSDVKSIFFLGYNLSGEEYVFEGERYPPSPGDFHFGKKFTALVERLWMEGRWKTHPVCLGSDGLVGVLGGMKQMKEGKVSGEKLVYRVDETEWP